MSASYGQSGYEAPQPGRASDWTGSYGQRYDVQELSPGQAALEFLSDYSRERPEVVAMWAFGIGFLLGWKLKPW